LIEYGWSGNPYYHKLTDYVEQPGYLDWGYLQKMCKGTLGYFATQLQPVDVTPQFLSFESGWPGGLLINASGLPRCQYAIDSAPTCCTRLGPHRNQHRSATREPSPSSAQAGSRPRLYHARAGPHVGGGVAPESPPTPTASAVGGWLATIAAMTRRFINGA
jgi:hypothetical protein